MGSILKPPKAKTPAPPPVQPVTPQPDPEDKKKKALARQEVARERTTGRESTLLQMYGGNRETLG